MLRLLSLNLNYRVRKHGDWPARRTAIARTARRHAVDVLALQAVEGAGGSQASELAELLGFEHVAFVAAQADDGVGRGSAFVSRYPLADVAVRSLSQGASGEDPDRRVVMRARIDTGNADVVVYNAHFSWIEPQAVENARETLAFLVPAPALLLGDLNSAPRSAAIELLRRGGWIDLWEALHDGDPGYTFEADQPTQRIDYALATPELRPCVRDVERVGADSAPPRLSDHLALLVTLEGAPRSP